MSACCCAELHSYCKFEKQNCWICAWLVRLRTLGERDRRVCAVCLCICCTLTLWTGPWVTAVWGCDLECHDVAMCVFCGDTEEEPLLNCECKHLAFSFLNISLTLLSLCLLWKVWFSLVNYYRFMFFVDSVKESFKWVFYRFPFSWINESSCSCISSFVFLRDWKFVYSQIQDFIFLIIPCLPSFL